MHPLTDALNSLGGSSVAMRPMSSAIAARCSCAVSWPNVPYEPGSAARPSNRFAISKSRALTKPSPSMS